MTGDHTPRPGWALFCAATGFGVVIMHTTAVNVALPSLQETLGGEVAGLQWCVNAYALVLATLLLPFGAMADRFGARRMFVAGLSVFAVASLASASAHGIALLIVGQAVAGAGAAMVAPTALAILRESYPEPKARMRAIGKLSLGLAAGFGLGPIVGGALVGLISWRAVFFIDAPCAIVLVLLALRFVPPSETRPSRALSVSGVVLGATAVGALAFALTDAGSAGWTATPVLIAAAVSVAAGATFVMTQRRSSKPLIPPRLLAIPEVTIACAIGLIFNISVYGQIFVLSITFQEARGLSPLETGLLFLPQPIGTISVAVLVGHWLARSGPRPPLIVGLALSTTAAVTLLALDSGAFPIPILIGLYMMGVGGGLVVPSLHTMIGVGAPADLVGIASAALNANRQIGGVLGVAVMGSLIAAGDLMPSVREALIFAAATQVVALVLVLRRVRASVGEPELAPSLR
ncbi:MAG: MFS transporter [Solirubrobacteraceae bacterium]|nr:MFS transporter [Solirubrobacteraceae bacterium]